MRARGAVTRVPHPPAPHRFTERAIPRLGLHGVTGTPRVRARECIGVLAELASAPKGRFDDLCDTVSAALIHLRDRGQLSLGEEFRREERRHLVYRSRAGGPSIRELYEDV